MNLTESHLNSSSKHLRNLNELILISVFIFFTGACLILHAEKILHFAFPIGALVVSLVLYQKNLVYYISFCWWLWFLTAWVARLSDYQSHVFDETRFMMVAPYFATLVILPDFISQIPKLCRDKIGIPFVISFAGIIYSVCIGLINNSLFSVFKTLLDTLIPVLFSYFFCRNWRDYLIYSRNTQRVFCAGLLVMGTYGIIQYVVAPEADKFWVSNMISIGKNSFGRPESLGLRTFSTMHSPGPYAVFIMAGLLLSLSGKGSLQFPSAILGYLNLILTLVRSAWGGWALGLAILFTASKPRLQIRLLLTILLISLCVIPLTKMEPFSEVISSRVESLTDLENDGSGQIRRATYAASMDQALTSFVGKGFGSGIGFDSAILDTLINLGWVGTIYYVGGLVLLVMQLFWSSSNRTDPFINASRAILLSSLMQLLLGNLLVAPSGVILWGFLGLGISGCRYHEQRVREEYISR